MSTCWTVSILGIVRDKRGVTCSDLFIIRKWFRPRSHLCASCGRGLLCIRKQRVFFDGLSRLDAHEAARKARLWNKQPFGKALHQPHWGIRSVPGGITQSSSLGVHSHASWQQSPSPGWYGNTLICWEGLFLWWKERPRVSRKVSWDTFCCCN